MWKRLLVVLKSEVAKATIGLLLSLTGIVLFSYVFVALLPDQTAGLGAAYALLLLLASIFVFVVDRIAVRKFSLVWVNLLEFTGAIAVFFFILWSYRSVDLVVDTKYDHFTLVFLDGGIRKDDFEYVFPFSKRLIVRNQECVVLDNSLREDYEVRVKPSGWSGYSIDEKYVYTKGGVQSVIVYWTGNTAADTKKFLKCAENL